MNASHIPIIGLHRIRHRLDAEYQEGSRNREMMHRFCPQIVAQEYLKKEKMTADQHPQHQPGRQTVETLADDGGLQGHEKGRGKGSLVGIPEAVGGLKGCAEYLYGRMGLLPYLMGQIAIAVVVCAGMIVARDIEKRKCRQNQYQDGQKTEPPKFGG